MIHPTRHDLIVWNITHWNSFWRCIFIGFVSLLSYFWHIHFSPTPALRTRCRPCQATCVQSHKRQPRSSSHMSGPGIGCWFLGRSNSSQWCFKAVVLPINTNIYIDQCESTLVQYVDNHSSGLCYHHCCCICICWDVLLGYSIFRADFTS